jgi:hypothetical protein
MRVAGRFLFGGFLALTAACGSDVTEPGALVITLNGPPPGVSTSTTFPISGQVTRTPSASDQTIVVTAAGGAGVATDTAAADGSFAFNVTLIANNVSNLSISASDQSGSSATPVTLTVRHDAIPPAMASMTPASGADGATPATIQIAFTEPVVPSSLTASLASYGTAVTGSATLSADSLTLTFTPNGALTANAVHVMSVANARDPAGNSALSMGGCFVTGGAAITVFPDTGPLYVAGNPTGLVPPDLSELRLARTATSLLGIMKFDAPRSLTPDASNNTSVWIDLDTDQDGGTGFIPFKDIVFAGLLAPSGASAEFFIEMGTLAAGEGAFAAQYTAQDTAAATVEWTGATAIAPAACGLLLGFSVPFSALGSDDGVFDATVYVDSFDASTGILVDPAPDEGVYSASLPAAAAAPRAVAPGTVGRAVVARGRPFTLRVR